MKLHLIILLFCIISLNAFSSSSVYSLKLYNGDKAKESCQSDLKQFKDKILSAVENKMTIFDIDCEIEGNQIAVLNIVYHFGSSHRFDKLSMNHPELKNCQENSKQVNQNSQKIGLSIIFSDCKENFNNKNRYELIIHFIDSKEHHLSVFDHSAQFSELKDCVEFTNDLAKLFNQANFATLSQGCKTRDAFLGGQKNSYQTQILYNTPLGERLEHVQTQEFQTEKECIQAIEDAKIQVQKTSSQLITSFCSQNSYYPTLSLVFKNKLIERTMKKIEGLEKVSPGLCQESLKKIAEKVKNDKTEVTYAYCQSRLMENNNVKAIVYRPTIFYKELK